METAGDAGGASGIEEGRGRVKTHANWIWALGVCIAMAGGCSSGDPQGADEGDAINAPDSQGTPDEDVPTSPDDGGTGADLGDIATGGETTDITSPQDTSDVATTEDTADTGASEDGAALSVIADRSKWKPSGSASGNNALVS